MKSFINDISDEFGKADPAIAKEIEETWREHSSVLIPKLGNFKGHLCEAVHYERLRKVEGFEVTKHPNGQKESPDIEIKFGDKKTPGIEYILAVCLFPQTKKLEWRYALYNDLPSHSKHPGRIASALKIPIDPEPSDIWKSSIENLIKKKS
jgi:hypothetical protein